MGGDDGCAFTSSFPRRRESSARTRPGSFEWRKAEVFGEVAPAWVGFLDKADFPRSLPLLQAFLSGDRMFHRRVLLEPDEAFHAVVLGETFERAIAMLMDAGEEIAGHADVESAIAF